MDGAGDHQDELRLTRLGEVEFDDLLREVLNRVEGVLDEQVRLRLLLDAVVTMAADLTLDGVLARIVAIASSLVDAQYAALGVLDVGPERRLRTFIHHGMGEERWWRSVHCRPDMGCSGCSSTTRGRSGSMTSLRTPRRTASRSTTRR